MSININVQDKEIAEKLRAESKEELRTVTQQVTWILREHYKVKDKIEKM